MADVIQSGKSDAQRIADRLKGSQTKKSTADTIRHALGKGPTGVVHFDPSLAVQRKQHGPVHPGEGWI